MKPCKKNGFISCEHCSKVFCSFHYHTNEHNCTSVRGDLDKKKEVKKVKTNEFDWKCPECSQPVLRSYLQQTYESALVYHLKKFCVDHSVDQQRRRERESKEEERLKRRKEKEQKALKKAQEEEKLKQQALRKAQEERLKQEELRKKQEEERLRQEKLQRVMETMKEHLKNKEILYQNMVKREQELKEELRRGGFVLIVLVFVLIEMVYLNFKINPGKQLS